MRFLQEWSANMRNLQVVKVHFYVTGFVAGIHIQIAILGNSQVAAGMDGGASTGAYLLKPAGIILKLFIQQEPVDIGPGHCSVGGLRIQETADASRQAAGAVL